MSGNLDIKENEIVRYDEELMPVLLMVRTRSNKDKGVIFGEEGKVITWIVK